MKKTLLPILLLVILTGCKSHMVAFDVALNKVAINGKDIDKSFTDNSYEDEFIDIDFQREPKLLHFNLTNKTNQSMEIDWSRSALINQAGLVEDIMHKGVKIIDRKEKQKNSIIPSKSTFVDYITTVDAPYVSELTNNWQYKYLFTWSFNNKEALYDFIDKFENKPVRLLLHLLDNQGSLEYDFEFLLINPIDKGKQDRKEDKKRSKEGNDIYFVN